MDYKFLPQRRQSLANIAVTSDSTGIREYLKKGRQEKEILTLVYYSMKKMILNEGKYL